MGYDSFLGEFVGDGVTLRFDYGRYSNGYLKNAKKPAHIVSKRSIGGRSAKVANPRTPGSGLTGVYVKLGGHNALWLWGKDLTSAQQELVLKDVRHASIRRSYATVCYSPTSTRTCTKRGLTCHRRTLITAALKVLKNPHRTHRPGFLANKRRKLVLLPVHVSRAEIDSGTGVMSVPILAPTHSSSRIPCSAKDR